MKKLFSLVLVLALVLPALALGAEEAVMINGPQWKIPTTISMPEGDGPFPFVVMFHGTGSDRNEAGGGYAMLAPMLAEAGIASARFDFVGSGDSAEDYINYTLTSGMEDGNAVIAYMQAMDNIDPDRIGVLGWSQGSTVAMLTASRNPKIRSMVTWAGAVDMSGFMADQYNEARANGHAVIEFDWRSPLNLSLAWYDEVRTIKIAEELKNYDGAVLAMAGSLDDVVPLTDMDVIIAAAPTEAKQKQVIEGADHTFNVFSGDMSAFNELAGATVAWFQNTL